MGSNFALGPGPGGSCLEGQVVGKGREGGREGRGGAGGMGNRDIWFTRSGLDNAIYVWID
jgi:hypothetical protein